MSVVGGPELLAPVQSEPFDECAVPPVLFGTGTLWIADPTTGIEVDAGNFNAVSFTEDAEGFRFFAAAENGISPGAVTRAWRLELVGDYYYFEHIAKIVNEARVGFVGGEFVPLTTVKTLPVYRIIFRRWISRGDPCDPESCPSLEIELWRAFFDATAGVSMNIGQPTAWTFDLLALPDYDNHPGSPFGVIREICPIAGLS